MNWRQSFGLFPEGFLANVGWQYVANMAVLVIGFAYSIVMAKALGASDFGLLSLVLGAAAVVFGAFDFRLNEAVIKYLTEYQEQRDPIGMLAVVKLSLVINVLCGTLALGVFVAAGGWIAEGLVRDPRASSAVLLAGAYVFTQNVSSATSAGVLRVFGAFQTHALVRTVNVSLQLAVAVGAFVQGWGVLTVLACLVGTNVATNAWLLAAAWRELSRHIAFGSAAPAAYLAGRRKEMRQFVLANYGLSLSSLPLRDVDITVLGAVAPLEAVGVYRIAKNFMSAVWQLSDPAFYVVYPEIAKLWVRQEFRALRSFVRRLTLLLAGAAGVLFVGSFVAAPVVIRLALGPEYAGASSAFRWMLPSLLIWMPLLWVHPVLCAAGQPGRSLRASVIANILALGLYFTLIPAFGLRGAAIAYAAGVVAFPVLALLSARRGGLVFPPGVQIAPILP